MRKDNDPSSFWVHEENVEYVTRYGVYAIPGMKKKENI